MQCSWIKDHSNIKLLTRLFSAPCNHIYSSVYTACCSPKKINLDRFKMSDVSCVHAADQRTHSSDTCIASPLVGDWLAGRCCKVSGVFLTSAMTYCQRRLVWLSFRQNFMPSCSVDVVSTINSVVIWASICETSSNKLFGLVFSLIIPSRFSWELPTPCLLYWLDCTVVGGQTGNRPALTFLIGSRWKFLSLTIFSRQEMTLRSWELNVFTEV